MVQSGVVASATSLVGQKTAAALRGPTLSPPPLTSDASRQIRGGEAGQESPMEASRHVAESDDETPLSTIAAPRVSPRFAPVTTRRKKVLHGSAFLAAQDPDVANLQYGETSTSGMAVEAPEHRAELGPEAKPSVALRTHVRQVGLTRSGISTRLESSAAKDASRTSPMAPFEPSLTVAAVRVKESVPLWASCLQRPALCGLVQRPRTHSDSPPGQKKTKKRRRVAFSSKSEDERLDSSSAVHLGRHPSPQALGFCDTRSSGTFEHCDELRIHIDANVEALNLAMSSSEDRAHESIIAPANERDKSRETSKRTRKWEGESSEDEPLNGRALQPELVSVECFGVDGHASTAPYSALLQLSATADAKTLAALAGSAGSHRTDVMRAMQQGCTQLKLDYWTPAQSDDLTALSASFATLMEHQRVGVRWLRALHSCVRGMILADEMGLGKTLQVLCFLETLTLSCERPSLVVVPASLLGNWEAEAAKWTPGLRLLRYHAPSASARLELQADYFKESHKYNIVLTTPGALHCRGDQAGFFRRIDFECLVVDEAHGLKNSQTARYQDLLRVVKCRRRVLLTGTPVQNSLTELATLLSFALYERGTSDNEDVVAALQDITAQPHSQALRELQTAAGPFILRRLKADVLAELPAKHGVVVYCDLEGEQHTMHQNEIEARRQSQGLGNGLKDAFYSLRRICLHPLLGRRRLGAEQLSRLVDQLAEARPDFRAAPRSRVEKEVLGWSDFEKHQAAVDYGFDSEFRVSEAELHGSTKMRALLEILQRQASRGDKTLVFSQFTQLLNITEACLDTIGIRFCRLDGKTAIDDRQVLATMFQGSAEGPLVFLISTKAGGMGLNLTAANAVVMLDLDFNPQNTRQAEDRVHRLGQTREVTVYYLVCRGTVEEMVLKRSVSKLRLDQQFGARRAVLEIAAARDDTVGGVTEEVTEDCERQVLAELGRTLGTSVSSA